MKKNKFLFDTHALIFWINKEEVSAEFIDFFDAQTQKGNVFISSASIWEIALLTKKGRLSIPDLYQWKNDLLVQSSIQLVELDAADMIDSTLLPYFHKDPFDRLLIAQAYNNDFILVSRDKIVASYPVERFWI